MNSSGKEAWLPGQPTVMIPRPQLTADVVSGGGYGGPAATEPPPPGRSAAAVAGRHSPYQPAVVGSAPVSYRYDGTSDGTGQPPVTAYRV